MFQIDGQNKIGQDPDEPGVWQQLEGEIQEELNQVKKEIDEIKLMIEQSRLEVGKLADRNKAITATMQRVQAQFETLPREDIRSSYDSALDSQQRLFVMRGQLEKLESDKNTWNGTMRC